MRVDAAGVSHPSATGETRIVSLVPSITELLCDLGLADQVVGRTGFCVHPRDKVRRIAKVGGTKDVNLRKLRTLAPTHVIVNVDENRRETALALREWVPQVIVTHPLAPLDNLALYRLIGGIFRREQEAERLCAAFRAGLERLDESARAWPEESVLYLIWRDPWMAVSPDTYISRMLALVNWQTLPRDGPDRYPRIEQLEVAAAAADRILLSTEPYRFTTRDVAGIERTLGLSGSRVALIDAEMTSWYGSRAIAGLDYLRQFRSAMLRPLQQAPYRPVTPSGSAD